MLPSCFMFGLVNLLFLSSLVSSLSTLLIPIFTCYIIHIFNQHHLFAFSLAAICNKEGRLYVILDTIGFVPKPQHRKSFNHPSAYSSPTLTNSSFFTFLGCPIPVAYDPDKVLLPTGKTQDTILRNLTYITEDESSMTQFPLFGGNITWSEREESFKLRPEMKVKMASF